jgi:hypothetical protein
MEWQMFQHDPHHTGQYKKDITNNKPPDTPDIDGKTRGKSGKEYEYTFNSADSNGDNVRYYINWGYNTSEWTDFNSSGTDVKVKHTWNNEGTYIIKAKAQDIHGAEGLEGFLTVEIPRTKTTTYPIFYWFLDRFPLLERLLSLIRVI